MFKNELYVVSLAVAELNEVRSRISVENKFVHDRIDYVVRKLQGLIDDDAYYRAKKEKEVL